MAEIINMSSYTKPIVSPKRETKNYKGQTITLTFCPGAEAAVSWLWHVKYTEVYEFTGMAASVKLAMTGAQKLVDTMKKENNHGTKTG